MERYVSEITYRSTFCTKYNRALFSPKKDQCEICSHFKTNTNAEDVYKEHLCRRDEANASKNADKIRAVEDAIFLSATFDLQSILKIFNFSSGVPQMYYSLKLCAYSFTIYEAAPLNNAFCYAWMEINRQKGKFKCWNGFVSMDSEYFRRYSRNQLVL